MLRFADIVFWIAIMLWFALAVVGGVAAMAIFPAARELPLSMAGYESFIGAEPVLGRQLVAGFFVERVFGLAQVPRAAVAALTVAALAAQLVLLHRAGAVESLRGLRIAATTCALAALAVGFLAIIDFQIADRRYRGLAQDERTLAEALVAKAVVDREHAFASNVMTAEVVSLLALAALTAASTRRNRRA